MTRPQKPRKSTDSPIARWRDRKGWTQQELATKAGLHAQTVSEAEREYRGKPATSTLEDIAAAFNISVDQLLAGPEPNGDTEPARQATP